MLKSIQLKLAQIKYSGDSIGDDIRVEIEALGKFLRVDKTIKIGTAVDVNEEIGRFETDQKLFKAGVKITVIEKDALFNDVGGINSDIKIDTSITKPQRFVYKVQIKETRSVLGKSWGKKIASFEIILKANVTDAVRYVSNISNEDKGRGWLGVKFADNKVESLPAYLKVRPEYISNGREYFTPLEGAYRDKLVSAQLGRDDSSNLIDDVQHKLEARATYSISTKLFILNGKKYQTVDYPDAPWEKGLYDIEIPDYPHPGGASYERQAPRAKTWFRIGHSGARYLHVGRHSAGCMTITETTRWMEIYNALIKARKGDFMSVGVLEVID